MYFNSYIFLLSTKLMNYVLLGIAECLLEKKELLSKKMSILRFATDLKINCNGAVVYAQECS